MSGYKTTQVEFNLKKDQDIDYFKIPVERLHADGFTVTEKKVAFTDSDYLDLNKQLSDLNHDEIETVVFNVQVGKGKTSVCYQLINKYAEDGYTVIVCSPFKKLVEKDEAELKKITSVNIANYRDYVEEKIIPSLMYDYPIQIMTINCLLHNPGEDQWEQAFWKKFFIANLIKALKEKDKKVVIFFDEIHESIHNFKSELIPYLLKWKDVVHKCFVSSATFIEASVPVIKYISLLTDNKIKVYDAPRVKTREQANLHLHIIGDNYNGDWLLPLHDLATIIEKHKDKQINILTGHKALTKGLLEKTLKKQSNYITKEIIKLKPIEVTGDTENKFKPDGNNVGTTFKTGVNINDPNSIFIIIFPVINETYTNYGIFTDGIPSIIQAVARMRNGGEIHLFLPQNRFYITSGLVNVLRPNEMKKNFDEILVHEKERESYWKLNTAYDILQEFYNKQRNECKEGIELIETLNENGLTLLYNYPSIDEFIINDSQHYLVERTKSFGNELSPYIIWASIYNQFCNATLKAITYTTKNILEVHFTSENIFEKLETIITKEAKEKSKYSTLAETYLELERAIEVTDKDGAIHTNVFTLNGESITYKKLKKNTTFIKALMEYSYNVMTKEKVIIEKGAYINTCINQAQKITDETPIIKCYKQLGSVKNDFIAFIEHAIEINPKNEKLIHRDCYKNMPDKIVVDILLLLPEIRKQDFFIKSKAISLFQDLEKEENVDDKKKMIFKEFKSYCAGITDTRKTLNKLTDEYYLIDDNMNYPLYKCQMI